MHNVRIFRAINIWTIGLFPIIPLYRFSNIFAIIGLRTIKREKALRNQLILEQMNCHLHLLTTFLQNQSVLDYCFSSSNTSRLFPRSYFRNKFTQEEVKFKVDYWSEFHFSLCWKLYTQSSIYSARTCKRWIIYGAFCIFLHLQIT